MNQRDVGMTAYDSTLSAPNTVAAEVAYVSKGVPIGTRTESIVILPTPAPIVKETPKGPGAAILSALGLQGPKPMPEPTFQGTQGTSFGPKGSSFPQSTGSGNTGASKPWSAGNNKAKDLFGISYAPYRGDHSCKSADDIQNDFSQLKDYSMIRIYGTDCDQVPNVHSAAKNTGAKLMLGIWDINDVQNEASKIVAGVNGGWDMIKAVSVGNELVNKGEATPQQVVDAVTQARSILRSAGYEGPVVTVDTFNAVEMHPELCQASDFCAINAHAFFDSNISADNAGQWLVDTVQRVKSSLSKPQDVVITETGWPMDGSPNGLAIPSLANQKLAIDSIKKAFSSSPSDVVLFSAFNDLWKSRSMDTFNAEQYYGIGGAISTADL